MQHAIERHRQDWSALVAALAIGLGLALAPRGAHAQATEPTEPTEPTESAEPAALPAQPAQGPVQMIYVQPDTQTYAPAYGQPQPLYTTAPARQRRGGGANIGLLVTGGVMLGIGWIVNFIVGLPAGDDPFRSGSEPEWEAFRISSVLPVAGPWIQLGVKPTGFTEDYWAMWLIIDGLLQLAGTTMLIVGAATSGGDEPLAQVDGLELRVAPVASPNMAGLALTGRF